ncbi:MAG: hypothetical protein COW19_02825 [Zetaproteobacteria bacterium CG12_big_fil_rev_8_21_14_0_65_55_1124]|nr:MAG: hypothetical protein AUJ58_01950 [Zetaproteobacteria bacterium CG1_02_55_237]PIW43451.1 MAG: hypothetical protein COW19_02825 [Zetaproteobacteria bacterium CG12_big_fil_rev_8_21_14_0_65_55_1124]PIY53986.1 MAG: hypothetical protein COZ01_01895 [Zetaproteobacteria bacterium CG_4_10_14_0_8_um_filter_55_43]PIZ39289.1 MAG: hypothetical protein COY36_03445 [Zetaproteobacteria bacterium CG_4_10_14_0_2_um_filter_55_20]PJB81400.1 MAG: hypothetical protein CO089_04590 [Zetaproteobacteria bacteriu
MRTGYVLPTLLDHGADPNAVYNYHVPGSATDWAMAMTSSREDDKRYVYQSILNSLKQYGGLENPARVAAIEDKLRDFKRKESADACTVDAKKWIAAQEAFRSENRVYPPNMVNNLPESLKLIAYQYSEHSFAVTFACKLVADSNWVIYNSESDIQPSFR